MAKSPAPDTLAYLQQSTDALAEDWATPQKKAQSISEEAEEGIILLLEKFDDHNWLDVFNLRTGFFLQNTVPSLKLFVVRWACTFLVNGVVQASKDDEWDDFKIFLNHFCPTMAHMLRKKFSTQDISRFAKTDCEKLVSISDTGKLTNVIVKGASQAKYYNLYYTATHLLLKGIFTTDADCCNRLRSRHFKRFRALLSAFFSVPAQNKIWAECVAEVVLCTLGEIEDSSRDDVLIEFVKCFGAMSQSWKNEKISVLALILRYLPPHISLEIIDLFLQDQQDRVLTPHKYTNLGQLTGVIQEWILIVISLGESWNNKKAEFFKKCVWVLRENLGLLVLSRLNCAGEQVSEKDLIAERVRSFVLDCSPLLSPLPVLFEDNMDFKRIEEWLSDFIK